jgi:hypothetical protein
MIRITDKKLIIEITSASPIDDLFQLKRALSTVLECINVDEESERVGILDKIRTYTRFQSALDFSYAQMEMLEKEICKSNVLKELFTTPAA